MEQRPETKAMRVAHGTGEVAVRVLNVFLASAALLVLLPIILVVALLIKMDSSGPVIFRQRRIGLNRRAGSLVNREECRRGTDLGGRPFTIYKFRTMWANAERETGPVWARENDLRVTRVGKALRATRLDEIPQFLNVIQGDMAIVGPRPERPGFVMSLREEIQGYPLRNQVPPGITGWAQVNRGYDQSLDDVKSKVEYDLEYVRRRSLWFDLEIMLKTVPVVFNPSQVYGSRHERTRKAARPMIVGGNGSERETA